MECLDWAPMFSLTSPKKEKKQANGHWILQKPSQNTGNCDISIQWKGAWFQRTWLMDESSLVLHTFTYAVYNHLKCLVPSPPRGSNYPNEITFLPFHDAMGLKAGAVKYLLWMLTLLLCTWASPAQKQYFCMKYFYLIPFIETWPEQLASPGQLPFQREWEKAGYSRDREEVIQKWTCKRINWSKVSKFTKFKLPKQQTSHEFVTDEVDTKSAESRAYVSWWTESFRTIRRERRGRITLSENTASMTVSDEEREEVACLSKTIISQIDGLMFSVEHSQSPQ